MNTQHLAPEPQASQPSLPLQYQIMWGGAAGTALCIVVMLLGFLNIMEGLVPWILVFGAIWVLVYFVIRRRWFGFVVGFASIVFGAWLLGWLIFPRP